MTDDRLLVAVATDGAIVEWQARCIEALAAVPGVRFERWVRRPASHDQPPTGKDSGALTPTAIPDALTTIEPEDDPADPPSSGPERHLDVLLDLTADGIAAPVAWASEVWRYGYGPTLSRDPARTALIDYVRGPGTTMVALVSEPSGAIIREGRLQTVSWWTGRPLERLLQDPADWPSVAALERTNPSLGDASSGHKAEPVDQARSRPASRHTRAARTPQRLLEFAAAGRRVRAWPTVLFRHVDWNIGIVPTPIEQMLTADGVASVTWLPVRPGRFAADPFGIERDGVLHVLFEDYDQATSRGAISHVAIDPSGAVSDPVPVFDPGVHVSYPYLIENDGGIFMLPEISAAGELVLYEAVDFPRRWRPAATLLPGIPAADASVIEHDGRWWMFATRVDRGANHNLYIWHAPQLTGPWVPHAANPVKTDARSARPAGTPFVAHGELYRPGQDNSRRYGGRIIVNRVDVLTPTAFREQAVKAIGPRSDSPYPDGLHTMSRAGARTLIDGNGLHFVREVFRNNVASKLPGRQ